MKIIKKPQNKPVRYPDPPTPTFQLVCAFARDLAVNDNLTNRNLLRLISWLSHEKLKMSGKTFAKHLPTAMHYREKVWTILTDVMKNHHRALLRKQHREKLRNKQKGYHWTRHPVNRKPQTPALRITNPPRQIPPPEESPPDPRIGELLLCYPGGGRQQACSVHAPGGTPSTHAM
jgi:hypothetical protein